MNFLQRGLNNMYKCRGKHAFLRSNDWAPRPPPPLTHRKTEKQRQRADVRGGKWMSVEPNHKTTRKRSPL
jgi:hypothetical protein